MSAITRTDSDRTPERTETIRHDHDLRITPLPDRASPRIARRSRRGREHHLTLADGREREEVRDNGRIYHLRGSRWTCSSAPADTESRSPTTHDASHALFDENLRSLKEQGLIEARTVTHLRDGTVADVVSVTPGDNRCSITNAIPTTTLVLHLYARPLYAEIGDEAGRHCMVFTFMVPARSDNCHPSGARRPRQGRGSRWWPRRAKRAEP
jgi:hypothetical protein